MMNLIGLGSYGATIVGELWRSEPRRHYLTAHGIRDWTLCEASDDSLQRSRIVQEILKLGGPFEFSIGESGFNFPEPCHIVLSLGGTAALQLVQAVGEGELKNATIYGLIPFQFDAGYQQAIRIAVALKLWQAADPVRTVAFISANDFVAAGVSMATALRQIQNSVMDSVCAHVDCTAGFFSA